MSTKTYELESIIDTIREHKVSCKYLKILPMTNYKFDPSELKIMVFDKDLEYSSYPLVFHSLLSGINGTCLISLTSEQVAHFKSGKCP